jgi:hypothetical protein
VECKNARRAALERVAAYHETCLAGPVEQVATAINHYRADEQTASEVDATIHHYHRAARELWKFYWAGGGGAPTEFVAAEIDRQLADGHQPDWWQHRELRRR